MSFEVRGQYLDPLIVHSVVFRGDMKLILNLYENDSAFNWFCTLANLSTRELKLYTLEFTKLDDCGNDVYTDTMSDIVIVGGPSTEFAYSNSLVISSYIVSYKTRVRKFSDESKPDLTLWY